MLAVQGEEGGGVFYVPSDASNAIATAEMAANQYSKKTASTMTQAGTAL